MSQPLYTNPLDISSSGLYITEPVRPKLSCPNRPASRPTASPDSKSKLGVYTRTCFPGHLCDSDSDSDSVHSIPHTSESLSNLHSSTSTVRANFNKTDVLNNQATTVERVSNEPSVSALNSYQQPQNRHTSMGPLPPLLVPYNPRIPCSNYPVYNTPLDSQVPYIPRTTMSDNQTFGVDETLLYIGSKLETNHMEIISYYDPVQICVKKGFEEDTILAFVLCTQDSDPVEGLKQLSILSERDTKAKLIWITKNKIGFFERDSFDPVLVGNTFAKVFLKPICPPPFLFLNTVDVHFEMFKMDVMCITSLRLIKKNGGAESVKSDFSAFLWDIKNKKHQTFIHYMMDTLEMVRKKRGRKRKMESIS